MPELLLTIDTATRADSIAVSRGETVLGEIVLNAGGNHTDRLLLSLQQLLRDLSLTLEQFDAFAGGHGRDQRKVQRSRPGA
jgi:tRNA threonylcarbamoyladenosine biosynthesis protein TsaB